MWDSNPPLTGLEAVAFSDDEWRKIVTRPNTLLLVLARIQSKCHIQDVFRQAV